MAVGLAACFLMGLRKVDFKFEHFFLVVMMGVTSSKLFIFRDKTGSPRIIFYVNVLTNKIPNKTGNFL